MNLGKMGLSPEQIDLMDAAERVCRDLSPMDKVRAHLSDPQGHTAEDWAQIGALGWLAIAIPEGFGGVGLSLAEVVPVVEQMGRRLFDSPFVPTTLAAQAILTGGTDAQKQSFLPRLAEGTAATVADVELADAPVTAEATADGFTLSGRKIFVANLDAAEIVVLSAQMDDGPGWFVFDASRLPDTARRREVLIDETKRGYEIVLDGVTLPATSKMETSTAQATRDHLHLAGNLLAAAELVGATQACLDYTIDYLTTRKQFGKLIGAYQALKHPTVDAYVGYEKARSLLYAAAHSFGQQGAGEIAVRLAKIGAVKALSYAADRSIQFHGGFGFTYDCDAQLYRRRALFLASQQGDVRHHKRQLAKRLFA